MTKESLSSGDTKIETIISYLLIFGVTISVALEAIGIWLYFGTYGNLQISQTSNFFIKGENFFAFILDKIQAPVVSENALFFMTLGLIILILTPYIRAVTSFIYFAWEKNRKYVLITLFVVVVITLSLALH